MSSSTLVAIGRQEARFSCSICFEKNRKGKQRGYGHMASETISHLFHYSCFRNMVLYGKKLECPVCKMPLLDPDKIFADDLAIAVAIRNLDQVRSLLTKPRRSEEIREALLHAALNEDCKKLALIFLDASQEDCDAALMEAVKAEDYLLYAYRFLLPHASGTARSLAIVEVLSNERLNSEEASALVQRIARFPISRLLLKDSLEQNDSYFHHRDLIPLCKSFTEPRKPITTDASEPSKGIRQGQSE